MRPERGLNEWKVRRRGWGQVGEEYDFPSRGYSEGQAQFHESVTRGLSESPFEAAIARYGRPTSAVSCPP